MNNFTIKLMGTYDEVQIATAKIQTVWGVQNIEEMSGIFPSRQMQKQKHQRPFHRYITLDPHASIAIEDINGNKVKSKPFSKLFKRKEASNG